MLKDKDGAEHFWKKKERTQEEGEEGGGGRKREKSIESCRHGLKFPVLHGAASIRFHV